MVYAIPNCGFAQAYVISGSDGLMVVDVGSIGAAGDVERFIASHPDLSMQDVRFITATHFHIDHIGGMGSFLKKCPPSTEILFSPLVREYFHGKRKLSLIRSWFVGFVPASFWCSRYVRRFDHLRVESLSGIPLPGLREMIKAPCPEHRIRYFDLDLSPSSNPGEKRQNSPQTCPAGFDDWEVMETPGHTEDSLSFYNPGTRELICGDLIVNVLRGSPGRLNRFCWSREITKRTYGELLKTLAPAVVYPGHGHEIRHRQNALSAVETFD
ncbi:Glyoxylase, beta-lactamase superfamily II [Syntrophus gentianae]|uniref:Glyoxylase, beta-lactamase superfamily II n=1 Tax=Syntrophus gentianae TaxID=43775 RepID=A0A1H7ZD45_9BACT|nr:MBL fold metallo-hydrolase [Syntrophus gentianae]SEM56183.1 Glyoxylase, beta-lactamase superfamily II [Syntrophus gentianae]